MKGKILLLAALAMFFAGAAIAQPQQRDPKKQAQRIVKALELNNQQAAEFIDTYIKYKEACKAVQEKYPRMKGMPAPDGKVEKKSKGEQPPLPTDEEVEKSILNGFKRDKALIEVKEKYYWEFAKFLNPQQIQKMFMIENAPRGGQGQGQPNGNRQMPPRGNFPGGGPGMGGMTPPPGMW